jgi:excisionase family DNA binding protein
MDEQGRLLTVEEVAARLRAQPETVRRWLRAGELRGARPGGKKLGWRVTEADLRRFLEARGAGAAAGA